MHHAVRPQGGVTKLRCFIITIAQLLWFSIASAQTLIITPQVSTEYLPLFDGITKGIKAVDKEAFVLELLPKHAAGAIQKYNDRYDRIVALDRSIINAVNNAKPETPWRAGVFRQPPALTNTIKGISFNITPEVILSEIHKLAPKITTIHTVISDAEDPNFVENATSEASRLGMELVTHIAKTPRETAKAWFSVIENINVKREAVWISNENHLEDTKSFEFIVSSSWKKKILIVSSIPKHAARGIGLGFTPDFFEYGKKLAHSFDKENMTIDGLNRAEVKTIANVRTLRHLGYRSLEKADQQYDVVLPQ